MDRKLREIERKVLCGEIDRERLVNEGRRAGLTSKITIDGETHNVLRVRPLGWEGIVEIDTEEGLEFILAPSAAVAGKAARARWAEMAENDHKEFTCMVGEATLVQWALGRPAGPGSRKVNNLNEWLDLWLDTPAEEWASYDGQEHEVESVELLDLELGWMPAVAYRHN